METTITGAHELRAAAAVLHDARFAVDGVSFDARRRTFALKCWVTERRPAGRRSRRWRGYCLSFRHITRCEVNIRDAVRYYELATIRFDGPKGRIDLVAHYGIEIVLSTDLLDGALAETTEIRADLR